VPRALEPFRSHFLFLISLLLRRASSLSLPIPIPVRCTCTVQPTSTNLVLGDYTLSDRMKMNWEGALRALHNWSPASSVRELMCELLY
jgi:hypothetical protein